MDGVSIGGADCLSRNATEAFLGGIVQAIHSIDARSPETRSSGSFLQILDAALEQICQYYPDLNEQEREQLIQLASALKRRMSDPWVGFENLL